MALPLSCNQENRPGIAGKSVAEHSDHEDELPSGNNAETIAEGETDHLHEGEEADTHEEHMEDHTLYKIVPQPFSTVYKTSGMIMVDTKDEIAITANSPGIVRFEDHFLLPGVKVNSGSRLFTITGDNLTENNTSVNFAKVEADFLEARANLKRAESLIVDRLITEGDYLAAQNNFAKISAEYEAFKKSSGIDGASVKAPSNGFIKEVFIREGEVAAPGDMLAIMIIEHKMVLKAEIAPIDRDIIGNLSGARFKPAYSEVVYSTNDMNGSRISYGRSTGENSFYIPVYFRFDFSEDLIPGTFVDVWLQGEEVENALIIPNSAIMEEYGKYYVFVESEEGIFEKRYFAAGESNGSFTRVAAGLHEGENIVSEGAYQVKMSMMTALPSAHNHNH